MKYSLKTLPNGMKILLVPSSEAQSVVVDFFVKTGSRSEALKEHGISHFLEHFLFKGTQKYPTALAISELVDAIGGEMNANTGKEHTQYFIKAHSKYLKFVFEILTQMLQYPLMDEVELNREKGVIVEELNMYKDAPMYEIDNILEEAMWPQDALGRRIVGSKESVTSLTREMFVDFMKRHYAPSNIILAIAGKFDPKEVTALIKQHWLKVQDSKVKPYSAVTDKQDEPRVALEYKETEQAHLAFGFKSLDYTDKRNPALSVASCIMGGGMSSRLFTEVRERRGLAYYVRCSPLSYGDTGIFMVTAGVQVEKAPESIQVILQELGKIHAHDIPDKEIEKAKNYIIGKTTLALEDNQAKMDWYLDQVAFHQEIDTPKDYFKKIQAVTKNDIQKVMKSIINKNNLTLAIIGPYKEKEVFERLLGSES
ncbi:MAG TPA: pitrilysin family protein [Patescibacteria group bacterium]|nr:pitrilysin family protein [Patescibacteria group bacterium]